MKKHIILLTIIITLLISTGCASKEKPPRERDETYIADINPFTLDTYHWYTKKSMGKYKISDFTVSFAPRTNYIFLSTKIGINYVRVGFSYEERKALQQAFDQYYEELNTNTISRQKPNKKNTYYKGTALVDWGTTGLSRQTNTFYYTHAEFLESNKPYFRIQIMGAEEPEGSQVYSPSFCIYLSPAQWEILTLAWDQELLVDQTDKILEEANAF